MLEGIMQETIEASKKASMEIQMQTANISISFPLKGHQIIVTCMNPDLLYKIVEEIKKSESNLSLVKKGNK